MSPRGATPFHHMLRRCRRCALLAPFALLLVAAPVHAQDAADCSVATLPVAFGVYDPMQAAPLDGAGEIVVDCRRGRGETVRIALGTGNSGSYAARRMTRSGGGGLDYNLYLDANATRVFGDGTGGSQSTWCTTGTDGNGCFGSNPSGHGRRATLPFYGRIPSQQDVAAGIYTDTVLVRIDF